MLLVLPHGSQYILGMKRKIYNKEVSFVLSIYDILQFLEDFLNLQK